MVVGQLIEEISDRCKWSSREGEITGRWVVVGQLRE